MPVSSKDLLSIYNDMLDDTDCFDTNVDIVFVIDATDSMQPLLDKVKSLAISFREKLEKGLNEESLGIGELRVKTIVFRDFYVDWKYAFEKSPFYTLPDEEQKFYDFLSQIKAGGGGDEPESGLEALVEAMRSDFVQTGKHRRHIIILFTDASAHELEQQQYGIPSNYPQNMLRNLRELYYAWGGVTKEEALGVPESRFGDIMMSRREKRLVLFAPAVYPWDKLEAELENVMRCNLDPGMGGIDLELDEVIAMLSGSIRSI